MVAPPSVLAQSLVEHGSLDSVSANLQRSTDTVGAWLGSVSPSTWLVAAVILALVLIVAGRRRG